MHDGTRCARTTAKTWPGAPMSRIPRSSRPITATSSGSTPPRCGPSPTRSSRGNRNPNRSRCCGAIEDLRDHVLRSIELVSPEKAGRRVIYLNNPGRRDVAAAVGWLYSGLQVMKPGEVASAHQHSASALRFIMEGKGAYTIVDGHKMTLGENDFVLTPNGTWHEHGVDADGTRVHLAGRPRHSAGELRSRRISTPCIPT